MYLRTFSASLAVFSLTACGLAETPEPEGETIECAIGAGADFTNVCTLEEVSVDEFIVHHPDGGFRRFTRSGDEIVAADGASEAKIKTDVYLSAEDVMVPEIAVDGDRYRLPSDLGTVRY